MVVGGSYAYDGAILKTTNGGQDWVVLISGIARLERIAFVDANAATAVGSFGTILRTTDGGNNWVSQTSGLTHNLTDVFFINTNIGFVVGEFGTILKTADGGATWTYQIISASHFEGIFLTDANHGTVVGSDGTIFRTTNGGNTWTSQVSGTTQILWDVSFFDMNRGIAVGQFGTYISTTDGGNTWVSRSLGTNQLFLRISFSDENNGAIVGTHGLILRTTNGGDNWILQDTPTDYQLNDVFFTSPDNGKAVGLNGTILKTINGGFVPVELALFSGFNKGDRIILNCSTVTETNNHGFEIQRKSGDVDWSTIGFKEGMGTTTEPQSYSFTDKNLSEGKYQYRLMQTDFDGSFKYSKIIDVEINAPAIFSLSQNYPNPFNPTTKIKYQLPELSKVKLTIYDVLGREVNTLFNEVKPAGNYELTWNAGDLPSGVYFYQLRSGNFLQTKKMILLK